jgi:hypothetical protein
MTSNFNRVVGEAIQKQVEETIRNQASFGDTYYLMAERRWNAYIEYANFLDVLGEDWFFWPERPWVSHWRRALRFVRARLSDTLAVLSGRKVARDWNYGDDC